MKMIERDRDVLTLQFHATVIRSSKQTYRSAYHIMSGGALFRRLLVVIKQTAFEEYSQVCISLLGQLFGAFHFSHRAI